MGAKGKPVPVLTPANGRRYKDKRECLEDYLAGKTFVFNLEGHPNDGSLCNISHTYYTVVKFKFGSQSFTYEGN